MKNLYKINITIFNNFGELVDTQLAFESLDEMSNKLTETNTMLALVEQARDFATSENMLAEEIYESKDEADLNEEDTYDGSSKIDLINSDEKFQ